MTNVTGPIHPPKTIFFIPKRSDTSIQTQLNSASDAFVGAHDVASARLDQSTNRHGKSDVKDNGKICSSSCFADTFTTTTTSRS